MLLLVSWDFPPDAREEVYDRFREVANKEVDGIEAIGRWHTVGRGGGIAVVKARDEKAAAGLALLWSDVVDLSIEPCLDDATYAAAIG